MGDATTANGDGLVPTVITRPGQAPVNVQWKVSDSSGSPKVVDIIAEGVSLSINERDDYASYLAHHGNDVQALIDALTRQVSHSS